MRVSGKIQCLDQAESDRLIVPLAQQILKRLGFLNVAFARMRVKEIAEELNRISHMFGCDAEHMSLPETLATLVAIISGDFNPAHMDPAYVDADMFRKIIAQGMLEAGLISAVLGAELPGPGTIYLGQDLRFLHPVSIGDRITATLMVTEKHPEKGDLTLDCRCINQEGELVMSGGGEGNRFQSGGPG